MNKELIPVLSISAILFLIVVTILNTAFKNGKFTCNRYILNTYLYVILAIIFISLLLSILKYKQIFLLKKINIHPYLCLIILFVGLIGSVFGIVNIDPKRVLLKHLCWLVFVLLITLSFHPIHYSYYQAGLGKMITIAFLVTLVLVLTLTAIAFIRPDFIKLSWGPVLFFLLLGVIIMELLLLLIKGFVPTIMHRIISYIVIFIFMGYLLYDTKMMQIRAKQCTEGSADYIKESVNIFLDIWNLFVRILSVQNISK